LVDALTEALKGIVAFVRGRVTTRSSASRSAPGESAKLTLPAKKGLTGQDVLIVPTITAASGFESWGRGGRLAAMREIGRSIARLA
jgi:hypothetical protein